MTIPPRWVLVAVALLAGILAIEGHTARARAAAAAQQAALAAEARHIADSLAHELAGRDARARDDSTAAAAARTEAARARATSDAAVAEAARLRRRLAIVGDSGVRVPGDTALHLVPAAVITQLRADSVAIAKQARTILDDSLALERSRQETANARLDFATSKERSAALERENAHLALEVKKLQPPKCGTVCGALLGAGGAIILLHYVR
jgi:hypothetical protein